MTQIADELQGAIRALRPYFGLALLVSVFTGLLTLAPIGYMREVYGPVVTARSEWTLAWVTLLLILALAMAAVLDWVRQRIQSAASVRFTQLLGGRIFEATFDANLQSLSGCRQALPNFRTVRMFISSPTAGALLDAPIGILMLGLIFLIHPLMGFMSLFGAMLSLSISLLTERNMRPVMTEAIEQSNRASAYAADAIRNAESTISMGMQSSVLSRWRVVQDQYLLKQAKATNLQSLGMTTTKFVMLLQGSAMLGVGMFLTLIGVLSPQAGAMLIVAKLIGAVAIRPMMQLINSWKMVATAWDSFVFLRGFLSKLPQKSKGMSLPPPRGHLEVKSASASPPGKRELALTDLTFKVDPGQLLVVVGPSGSGKSSLARLITGIWAPRLGEVRLDGVSVHAWNKDELGPYLGYLPQDVELFDGSVAENISRFGDLDPVKLSQAVQDAALADLISQLPNGLETELGTDGARLSGGQRQRIGLARALYGSPCLIVLDEPNANLDQAGDEGLSLALARARDRGATVVLITHRQEVIAQADLLLVMREGRPLVFGPREQVLNGLKDKGLSLT